MKTLPGWLQRIRKYFSSSISKKIITPYALLTLILAAMGVFIVTQLVASSFEERLKNQLLEAGRVVSDEVVNRERLRLEIERVVANTIGVADALVTRDIAQLDELISPVIANAGVIDSIIIVDTQGKEVLRFTRRATGPNVVVVPQTDTGLDLSGWVAVNKVLSDPEGLKEVQLVQDVELNELIIYTVGPIKNEAGDTVGAALVGTYLDRELEVLKSLALAQLTLFNENGNILGTTFALNADEQAEITQIFTPQRYQEVLATKEKYTLLDEVGIDPDDESASILTIGSRGYRLAYAPFVLRNRVVGVYAVALPTNFITEAIFLNQTFLVILFSVGVVTVFGVGYYISRKISNPVLKLVRTSQAISAGHLNERANLKQDDEIGILATAFDDMTDELQRLLQIQEEEASKLNAILNSIADGVVVQDTAGNILIVNPAAHDILEKIEDNLEPPQLSNTGNGEIASSGNKNQITFLLSQLTGLEFRETRRFEVGGQVFSGLSAPVVTSDNASLGSVVVLRDITREVESERLKDEFITSVSHELKTPLTAIKGYNNLLKMMLEMDPSGQMAERQLSIVKTMDKEVNDLDNIIQAMLDLSQIDAGALGIDQAPVNLSDLLTKESETWADRMAERDLTFQVSVPDSPIWVEGDQNRLTRVVHNLIKNAHDYTLPSGSIEVSLEQKNGRGYVTVKDTGVGIKEDDQRFLFRKFFRAVHEESHFGEVSGAGLGLYTSKAIVEAHDGEMQWDSVANKGSMFGFALPVIDPEDDDWDDPDDDWDE